MDFMEKKGRILLVDDEINAVKVLSAILSQENFEVLEAFDTEKAIGIINQNNVDLVLTDIKMPGKDGMYLFQYIKNNQSEIPVIFLSAYGSVEAAVHAMQAGAYYYFVKPPDYVKLKSIVSRAVEQRRMKQELDVLKQRLSGAMDEQSAIIGSSPKIVNMLKTIEAVKNSRANVLITGETGTGKELVAKALHQKCMNGNFPFVAVNCAAIPKELIEAEIFGYEKGAFTGANARRTGKFEEANNGTLFLDEIGELHTPLQAKLLRVLQEREIERIGGREKIKIDFRLICSTNRNLPNEIKAGIFREDLFYRINVCQIRVPPLRDRREDIPILVSKFLKDFCQREKKEVTVDEEVIELFMTYSWPGNVRQLRNVVEQAVVMTFRSHIGVKELPFEFKSLKCDPVMDQVVSLRKLETQTIRQALAVCKGNKSKTAKALGISRKCLYSRLNEINYHA